MNNFIKKEIENGNIYNYKDPRAYKVLNEYYISDNEANYYIERHKNSTKEFEIGDIVFVKSFKYNDNNIVKIEKAEHSPQLNTLLNILDACGYTVEIKKL